MDVIITSEKSYSRRYKEYCEVFDRNDILPVSCIKKEWISYLQVTIDVFPWQAVWKIPRLTCEFLRIHFPSIVLVLVSNVNFQEMKAEVKILAVQDDISIPETHIVPITQLWPTKTQDEKVSRSIKEIADALDRIRFFYLYLFMPWDCEDDDTSDWIATHLKSRLILYYDMKHGKLPRATAEHIHSLLTEARRLQNEKEHIALELIQSEEEQEEKLLDIHVKLLEIRTKIHILENPKLRQIKMKRNPYIADSGNSKTQKIWVICDLGNTDDYIKLLQLVKIDYPTETLMFATTLASILETSDSTDVFILNESRHNIHTTGSLEKGGVVKGVGARENVVLSSSQVYTVLDIITGTVHIENITINTSFSQKSAILIRQGKTILKNCEIIGDASSTHQGIVVLPNAELELENCRISGFSTAIILNLNTKLAMKNCVVHDVDIGLNIFDRAVVNLSKVRFQDCEQHAVVLETNTHLDNNKVGNFELLNIISDFTLDAVTGDNNVNGDVAIVQETPRV